MSNRNGKFQLFFTEKHLNHDKIWMLQNSSSNGVCFACAVETLDDATSLNVRKRRMVSDIMDLLTTNRSIWEIFARQKATLCHTGNVLLKLLSSKDKQLSTLAVDTLGVLVQRSKEENAFGLLEALVADLHERWEIKNQENFTPYFCFLGKILRKSASMVKFVLSDHQWLFELIVENIGQIPENQAISHWYILAQIYRSEHSQHVNIKSSKIVIEKIVSVLGCSVSKDLQLNILSVLMSFARNRLLCELIIDENENEFSLSQNSVANIMKKLMLSTSTDIPRISVQCLTEILKSTSVYENEKSINFSKMLMAKGLCELLFELLSSSERFLTASVFNCLQQFAAVKLFFNAGHVIYGIDAILESLKRAIAVNDRFLMNPALQLLLKLLQNGKSSSAIVKHTSCILEMIAKLSEAHDTKILNLAISCATETVTNDNDKLSDSTKLKSVMEQFGKKLSKKAANALGKNAGDPDTLNLLKNTLNFVSCCTRLLTNDNSHAALEDINELATNAIQSIAISKQYFKEIQHITDYYIIPSTVMLLPFVKDPEVFKSFFGILLVLISNSTDNALAKKLCESSFVRIASEVKAGLMQEDQASETGSLIDNFLVLLASKLDDTRDETGLNNTLSEALPFLQTAPSGWHLFFNNASSCLDMNIIYPIRLACISLLYLSARFGDPLWKSEVIISCLSHCMLEENQFQDLSTALKRHVIYLWAYARNRTNITDNEILLTEEHIISIIEKELKPINLFIREQCFIHWVICSATQFETKVWVLSELFSLSEDIEPDTEDMQLNDIEKSLTLFKNCHEFYTICTEILASQKLSTVKRTIEVISFVIGDGKDIETFDQIKVMINKIILSHGSELDHFNIVALLELYGHLLLSPTSAVSDVDWKLANRLCNLFQEDPTADVRIAVLNSLNQLLFHEKKSKNSSQVAVVCNSLFLEEVYAFVPRQAIYDGNQSEKLASASLVFLSQLITTISSQTLPIVSIKPIIVQKEVLIFSLACSDSPLMQLACLQFWNCITKLGPRNAHIFQREGEPLYLCEDDLKTILIYIQNLLLNEEQLIRDLSMKSMFQVVHALRIKNGDFHSPWNAFLLQHLLDNSSPGPDLEFKIKSILFLLKNETHVKDMTAVVSLVMKLIKNGSHDMNIDVIEALLQLICMLAKDEKFSVHQNTDINKFLHNLEDHAEGFLAEQMHMNETIRPLFTVYQKVLFPLLNSDHITMAKYLETITECKDIVTRQHKDVSMT